MVEVPAGTVRAVLGHALGRPPGLGHGRLVCVDGPSGSGKTTVATALATLASERGLVGVHVVHVDDLLEGWHGLPTLGTRLLRELVRPLAAGAVARYRRYDWPTGAAAEEHLLAPTDLLVLDGVGSGTPLLDPYRATLVWVEVDPEVGLARALARDGESLRERLVQWQREETEAFEQARTRERADVRVDDVGRLVG